MLAVSRGLHKTDDRRHLLPAQPHLCSQCTSSRRCLDRRGACSGPHIPTRTCRPISWSIPRIFRSITRAPLVASNFLPVPSRRSTISYFIQSWVRAPPPTLQVPCQFHFRFIHLLSSARVDSSAGLNTRFAISGLVQGASRGRLEGSLVRRGRKGIVRRRNAWSCLDPGPRLFPWGTRAMPIPRVTLVLLIAIRVGAAVQ